MLEPLSLTLQWKMRDPLSLGEWEVLLLTYMDSVAKEISQEENAIIGHIKAFAKIPDGGYIQINSVSANFPSTASSQIISSSSRNTLELSLNILVYGVTADVSLKISSEAASPLLVNNKGELHILQVSRQASHSSVHHTGGGE